MIPRLQHGPAGTSPSRGLRRLLIGMLLFLAWGSAAWAQSPPFSGTIFIDPNILKASDPTTFESIAYAGRGNRTMFDRRVDSFIVLDAFLFNVKFSDGLSAEIQVNPEFGSIPAAMAEANKYGIVIGRLPTVLRSKVKTVWIHQGVQPFGGGNNNLLIHTGQADIYSASGILEETFIHEAAHTSLDADHATAAGWLAAQRDDPSFISTYARDNPIREDIAESFLPYLALRYRSDRIPASLASTIIRTIPNRIAYFYRQNFNMFPITPQLIGCDSGRSLRTPSEATAATSIEFVNQASRARLLYWLDRNSTAVLYARLQPGQTYVQGTYVDHPWMVTTDEGACLGVYLPKEQPMKVILRD
jgi:hypothetical protein